MGCLENIDWSDSCRRCDDGVVDKFCKKCEDEDNCNAKIYKEMPKSPPQPKCWRRYGNSPKEQKLCEEWRTECYKSRCLGEGQNFICFFKF